MSYHVKAPMQHKKAMRVFERNKDGTLIAEYKGYYNANTDIVTLYPAHNPFILRTKPLVKHTINIREVGIDR